MANHQINITYVTNNPLATWTPGDKTSDRIKANQNDTLSFVFNGQETLTDAIVMTGPLVKETDRSPFDGGNQINIEPGAKYKIDKAKGVWGFSVAFTTVNAAGKTGFYFLPDPELEVGSNET